MPEWFADERFWADVFPFEFGEAAFAPPASAPSACMARSTADRTARASRAWSPWRLDEDRHHHQQRREHREAVHHHDGLLVEQRCAMERASGAPRGASRDARENR
jgi:hypothetical protein